LDEKKCSLLTDRLAEKLATRPILAWVWATGREPRIMLPLRIMLSLTGMERPMRPLAKSVDETFLIAPRMRGSLIARSRFEP